QSRSSIHLPVYNFLEVLIQYLIDLTPVREVISWIRYSTLHHLGKILKQRDVLIKIRIIQQRLPYWQKRARILGCTCVPLGNVLRSRKKLYPFPGSILVLTLGKNNQSITSY